jgi:hypothetical protein
MQRWFYLNRALNCGRVFEAYCDRMGINLGAVKFMYKGQRVFGADTLEKLQVGSGLRGAVPVWFLWRLVFDEMGGKGSS